MVPIREKHFNIKNVIFEEKKNEFKQETLL